MKEKKLRIEDALDCNHVLLSKRVSSPAAERHLLNAIPDCRQGCWIPIEGDEKTGVKIVLKALEEPVRQIAANAGFDGGVDRR